MTEERLEVKIVEGLARGLLEDNIGRFLRNNKIKGEDVYRMDYTIIRAKPSRVVEGMDTYACTILYRTK